VNEYNEPAFAVASHPHLPVYMTGGTKGHIKFWKYGKEHCIEEYATDSSWRSNTQDGWCINKIKVNSYGDQMAVNDIEGSLYVFSIGQNKTLPEVTLKHVSVMDTLDFDFMNQGTVVCTVGYKRSPHLMVHDLLMPTERSTVLYEKIGGDIVLCLHERKQLLVFNSREKGMKLFDMRKNQIQTQYVKLVISF